MGTQNITKLKVLFYITAIIFFLFSSLYNLKYHPIAEPDEGFLILLSKDFAHTGVYGISSVPGFKPFWLVMYGAGPILTIQLTLLIKLFGTNLLIARLLIFFYSLGFWILLYKLTLKFFNKTTGDIFLILYPLTFFYGYRSVQLSFMGEIPMLFFFVLGFYLIVKYLENNSLKFLLLGFLLFSLAFLTKLQALYLVVPSFMFLFLSEQGLRGIKQIFVSVAAFLFPIYLFFSWQLISTGRDSTISRYKELLLHGNAKELITLNTFENILQLPPILIISMFTSLLGLYFYLKGGKHSLLFKNIIISLYLTFFFSFLTYLNGIQLVRYFIPALLLNFILTAYVFSKLLQKKLYIKIIAGVVLVLIIILHFSKLMVKQNSLYEMSGYINKNIPTGKSIESNAWNVIPLTDRKYNQQLRTFYWFNDDIGKDYGILRMNNVVSQINSDYLLINTSVHQQVNNRYMEITNDKRELVFESAPFYLYRLQNTKVMNK